MKMFNLTELLAKYNISEERAFRACAAAALSAIVLGYLFNLHVFGIGLSAVLYYVLEFVEGMLAADDEKKARQLKKDTRDHVRHVLLDFADRQPRGDPSETHATVKRVVEDLLQIYKDDGDSDVSSYMNKVIDELHLSERGDDMSFLTAAAKDLFRTSPVATWEHVATLLCFGVLVCQEMMRERDAEECVELVENEISTYLLDNHRDWLRRNCAWRGFNEHFRNVTLET